MANLGFQQLNISMKVIKQQTTDNKKDNKKNNSLKAPLFDDEGVQMAGFIQNGQQFVQCSLFLSLSKDKQNQ